MFSKIIFLGRYLAFAFALFTVVLNQLATAEEDTNLRLNQRIEQDASQREQQLLEDEQTLDSELPTLIVNGREYAVGGDVNAMGRALYISIKQRKWPAVIALLRAYKNLPGADPMLIHYADGGLARVRGRLDEAEQAYRDLLALKADFLPGQLELARVLFESHKNAEAEAGFQRIHRGLAPALEKASGVRNTVETFLAALEQRRSWQGQVALGPGYNDNLNRSSESYTCLIPGADGSCFFDRSVPDAIHSRSLEYESTLEKTIPISGHHNVFVRGLAYGDRYPDHHDYNENSVTASAGYRYRSAENMLSSAPLLELQHYGNDVLYHAKGLRGEWMRFLSPRSALRIEGQYKKLSYRERFDHYDGAQRNLYATLWRTLRDQWTVFGGLDLGDKSSAEEVNAYQQWGLRLGASKSFQAGFRAIVFASLRHQQYDDFSAILEARRKDKEQNYRLVLEMPRFAFYGIEPVLTLEHSRVQSNVDWLYSYERSAVSLKFQYAF